MSLSYADVVSELAMVRDGVLALIFLLPMHVRLLSFCVLFEV